MIEYVILAVAVAVFLFVLLGLGVSALLRSIRPQSRPVVAPSAVVSPGSLATARTLLDAMTEVQRDAAAAELVKAMSDPANNPHIPPFLAKPGAKAEAPPVPNA